MDFQKAYDTPNWDFLEHIQEIMGFGSVWRGWIKQRLTTASISILINGSPTSPFKMERGIRQRDPLSPFLFVLVTEAFNQLMKAAADRNLIQGLSIGRENVNISHLQFPDDTLIFLPNKEEFINKSAQGFRMFPSPDRSEN